MTEVLALIRADKMKFFNGKIDEYPPITNTISVTNSWRLDKFIRQNFIEKIKQTTTSEHMHKS